MEVYLRLSVNVKIETQLGKSAAPQRGFKRGSNFENARLWYARKKAVSWNHAEIARYFSIDFSRGLLLSGECHDLGFSKITQKDALKRTLCRDECQMSSLHSSIPSSRKNFNGHPKRPPSLLIKERHGVECLRIQLRNWVTVMSAQFPLFLNENSDTTLKHPATKSWTWTLLFWCGETQKLPWIFGTY